MSYYRPYHMQHSKLFDDVPGPIFTPSQIFAARDGGVYSCALYELCSVNLRVRESPLSEVSRPGKIRPQLYHMLSLFVLDFGGVSLLIQLAAVWSHKILKP